MSGERRCENTRTLITFFLIQSHVFKLTTTDEKVTGIYPGRRKRLFCLFLYLVSGLGCASAFVSDGSRASIARAGTDTECGRSIFFEPFANEIREKTSHSTLGDSARGKAVFGVPFFFLPCCPLLRSLVDERCFPDKDYNGQSGTAFAALLRV